MSAVSDALDRDARSLSLSSVIYFERSLQRGDSQRFSGVSIPKITPRSRCRPGRGPTPCDRPSTRGHRPSRRLAHHQVRPAAENPAWRGCACRRRQPPDHPAQLGLQLDLQRAPGTRLANRDSLRRDYRAASEHRPARLGDALAEERAAPGSGSPPHIPRSTVCAGTAHHRGTPPEGTVPDARSCWSPSTSASERAPGHGGRG